MFHCFDVKRTSNPRPPKNRPQITRGLRQASHRCSEREKWLEPTAAVKKNQQQAQATGFPEGLNPPKWVTSLGLHRSNHTCSAFMVLFKPIVNNSLLIFSDHFHSASILRLQQKNRCKHLPLVKWLLIPFNEV